MSVRTRDWASTDLYATLGVSSGASDDDIGRSFRARAKELHPDVNAAEEERFKELTAAYEVLSDPRRRRAYDTVRLEVAGWGVASPLRPAAGPTVRPRSAPPPVPRIVFTRRRAWLALVAGIVLTLAGLGVGAFVAGLQRAEAAERSDRLPAVASRMERPGSDLITFRTEQGDLVTVPEPERVNPGRAATFEVLYDPDDPSRVMVDESTAPRDITLWIVALKLLVGGAVFVTVALRRLHRLRLRPPTQT